MIGSVDAVASRPASSRHVGDAVAADVVDAEVEQVRAVAGLLRGDRRRMSSQSSASIASRNALEPLALVRSPIISTDVSWRNGTGAYSELTPGSGAGARSARRHRSRIASATGADVLGRGAAAAADQREPVLA